MGPSTPSRDDRSMSMRTGHGGSCLSAGRTARSPAAMLVAFTKISLNLRPAVRRPRCKKAGSEHGVSRIGSRHATIARMSRDDHPEWEALVQQLVRGKAVNGGPRRVQPTRQEIIDTSAALWEGLGLPTEFARLRAESQQTA